MTLTTCGISVIILLVVVHATSLLLKSAPRTGGYSQGPMTQEDVDKMNWVNGGVEVPYE